MLPIDHVRAMLPEGAVFQDLRHDLVIPAGFVQVAAAGVIWASQGAEDQHHVHLVEDGQLEDLGDGTIAVHQGDEVRGLFRPMTPEERIRFYLGDWRTFQAGPEFGAWLAFVQEEARQLTR